MDQSLYDYSPIVERPPLSWPGGRSVAVYLGLNVEHFRLDRPATSTSSVTAHLTPDPMNYGWRDYGVRVGVWRLIELLDELALPASVLLNSAVCERYPQILAAVVERGWAILAHGEDNSTLQGGIDERLEGDLLARMTATIERASGVRPVGWLGPALTETFATPRLLGELGYSYVLDWCNDDQPYALNVPGMISVPYSVELNDINLFVDRSFTGPQYVQMVVDHLDQLLSDSSTAGRVMALPVHPFVLSTPARHRHLRAALTEVLAHEAVWFTTSDAIAAHYIAERGA
ncbi:MAG TPA: polysaccharide deacetylase family protein [Solirubrobacteraceae bacterium]|nr:polysaccharide deacetylase family protein [Solirubrobacteraceae bacterium]